MTHLIFANKSREMKNSDLASSENKMLKLPNHSLSLFHSLGQPLLQLQEQEQFAVTAAFSKPQMNVRNPPDDDEGLINPIAVRFPSTCRLLPLPLFFAE